MELKAFQRTALQTLETYLERAHLTANPEQAFGETLRQREPERNPPPYRTIPGLPGVANVCFRLPTGGGKTLLAAHSIAVTGRAYLEKDYPVVLWLVPTNTIRKQTAEALKKPSHPYRAAIDAAFDGRVSVFDVSEIAQIRPQDLTEQVCIVVCTIQTLRVTNTEGRKVYAHSENFEPHFTHVPDSTPGLERFEEGSNKGKIKFSFVNLMAVHRPLVIVDEAHKAGTNLSFEMLAALRPACIVEFTATPNADARNGSNVLFRASAAEVKAAQMIKLPIILTEHPDWRAAVHDAIETRAQLADTAQSDARYIRPLVLFQAQDKGQDVTVEVLKSHLIDNENIIPERIAVATGEQRELDTIDLFDKACPVEFIITVEALKEGWDCSFAYVLCSVANVGSATDIEQFLGRVLRMPYAESRSQEALNRAYAHVSSPRFGEGARSLADTLVQKMGFEPDEAAAAMEVRQAEMPGFESPGGLFDRTPILLETVETAPDLSGLDDEVTARVKVETRPDGTVTVAVTGDIPEVLEQRLAATVKPERREALRASVHRHRVAYQNSISPAERGEAFAVPRLFLNVQGELQLAEEELILDLGGWTLNDRAAELSPAEFSIRETAERWEVDLYGDKVEYKHLDQNIQLEIGLLKLDWTDLQLSRWLDRQCRQPDITQPVLLEFCRRLVTSLVETRRLALNELVRFKYQLAKAVQQKIAAYRREAYAKGYQDCLFGPQAQIETGFADGFAFDKRPYPAAWFYKGPYRFQKHFFGGVGELDSKGEEFECARSIDTLPQVKHWIRNLATRPQTSFWLPTSTDRFYPDFVAELQDGRALVIEYKGGHLADTQDTKEKRNIGQLWAEKSGGKGLFLMAEKRDAQGRDTRAQINALCG
ncbi:DEAD/DEAH box helicase [Candidatus Competibacter phosphatis]|uniref:DEAD/DEAH box helicase n=1 Tax=Candidatus Competibacter phosphatis TaxID=221280 RepID=A0ABX1TSH2_9GAMM|nr:DEAD/DEAH box helicase family protein [Candidatus Competibacter phosphatis]NMQ21305.1 DEAD/DEAH box helicase [Candidatus Competibacter phosphatis]